MLFLASRLKFLCLLDGPENVTVFPIKYVFNPGDILMCSTYSTLNPEFQWTEIQTGDVLKGSEIVINASMVRDEPYIFSCTATNKLTGAFVKSSLLTFAVKDKPVEDISPVTTGMVNKKWCYLYCVW